MRAHFSKEISAAGVLGFSYLAAYLLVRIGRIQKSRHFRLLLNTATVFQIWSVSGATVEPQRWRSNRFPSAQAATQAARTRTYAAAWCVPSNCLRRYRGLSSRRRFRVRAFNASSRIQAARRGLGSCGAPVVRGIHRSDFWC